MNWEAKNSGRWPGDEWLVEATDEDDEGQIYRAVFAGHRAEQRAREHAERRNGQGVRGVEHPVRNAVGMYARKHLPEWVAALEQYEQREHQMATEPENIVAEKVAARVFGDEALKHCAFDAQAAVAIASIVQMVLRANRSRLGVVMHQGPAVPAPSRPVGEQPVVGKA